MADQSTLVLTAEVALLLRDGLLRPGRVLVPTTDGRPGLACALGDGGTALAARLLSRWATPPSQVESRDDVSFLDGYSVDDRMVVTAWPVPDGTVDVRSAYRRRMVTVADVRALALTLPRTTEHLIRDRVKFRVGAIVYVAFSRDEATMGFGYSKEERDGLIETEPELFFLPGVPDLRFNWVCCHVARLDHGYMTELVCEAWRMVVPKFLARQRLGS